MLAVIGLLSVLSSQTPDTAYARLIREYTSDPKFLAASVAELPDHPTIPSPRDHFGTIIGAPGVMHRAAEIYGYMRALAAANHKFTDRFEQLEQAVAGVTGFEGADLKRIMRTGTVASTDNRNWELLPGNEPQRWPSSRIRAPSLPRSSTVCSIRPSRSTT